jgi:hypothetical protein
MTHKEKNKLATKMNHGNPKRRFDTTQWLFRRLVIRGQQIAKMKVNRIAKKEAVV